MHEQEKGMASQTSVVTRLFLVGCPRSGTTLLQSLLAAHTDIISFPESRYYSNIIPSRPIFKQLGLALPRARSKFFSFLKMIGHSEMHTYLPRFAVSIRQYSHAFIAVLDTVARQQNQRVWLEKTPRHLNFIDDIEALVPDAKFIHIVRNGEDVIASLFETANQNPEAWPSIPINDLNHCIDRWIQSIQLSQRYVGAPHHILVRYEDLVQDPSHVLKALCAFIGLPFEAQMLKRYTESAVDLILPFETWKQPVRNAIQIDRQRKFDLIFDDTQRRHISSRIAGINLDELMNLTSDT
jgi:hypothetical protein